MSEHDIYFEKEIKMINLTDRTMEKLELAKELNLNNLIIKFNSEIAIKELLEMNFKVITKNEIEKKLNCGWKFDKRGLLFFGLFMIPLAGLIFAVNKMPENNIDGDLKYFSLSNLYSLWLTATITPSYPFDILFNPKPYS